MNNEKKKTNGIANRVNGVNSCANGVANGAANDSCWD